MPKFTYPDQLLHEMFSAQAEHTPERVAIIDPGVEPGDYRQLSYAEVQSKTGLLGHWLRHKGVTEDCIVPIYMERCLEFALCYISILKAGGAYLPLEIGYPLEMMRRVLKEVEAVVTLTMPSNSRTLPDEVPRFELAEGWELRAALTSEQIQALSPITTGMDSLAYCVYSSGTTGLPKGITCPHRGSVFSYSHRMFAMPYASDGSDREGVNVFFVWEMLRPLLAGATLVVIPDSTIYDPPALASFLKANRVTRQLYTPSLLEALLDWSGDSEERRQALSEGFASMRVIVLCGEVVTVELRSRLLALAPHVTLLNLYSVSECHDVSMADLSAEDFQMPSGRYCPTGQLLPGVEVHIMAEGSGEEGSENLKAVPLGMPGEIYVSGPTLGRGYLKRPDLNAKRFPPRPSSFAALPKLIFPGQDANNKAIYSRMYDTGDWGRLLSDGSLEIMGRHDSMQKIRGYSVELRAVEVALLQCSEVTSCIVKAVGEEGTDKHITAFVVYDKALTTSAPSHANATASGKAKTTKQVTQTVRASLKARLPHYMVPSFFVAMDELPTHPISGKLDTKAFPKSIPDLLEFITKHSPIEDAAESRSSGTERMLTDIWAEVLELPEVMLDPDESFFDQGGHSLRAAKLAAKLTKALGTTFRVRALFDNPTIGQLVKYIDTQRAGADSTDSDGAPRITEAVLDQEVAEMLAGRPSEFDLQLGAFWQGAHRQLSRVASANSLSDLNDSSNEARSIAKLYGEKVLLTGATGFLGAFLLRELLANTAVATVFCLVRASTTQTATQRVMSNMHRYRIWNPEWITRVEGIEGDASLVGLGLSSADYQYLRTATDLVIHAAAQVNLIFPYSGLRRNNVLSTRNMIHLCMGGRVKQLIYISTDAVFREGSANNSEDANLRDELPHLTTGYAQSKCVAELLVQAAAMSGLPTVIIRPGNLGGVDPRSSLQKKKPERAPPIMADVPTMRRAALDASLKQQDPSLDDLIGASGWNASDTNFMVLDGCVRMGVAPSVAGWRCELTPIDYAAQAITAVTGHHESIGKCFNLVNPRTLSFKAIFEAFRSSGVTIAEVTYSEWRARLALAAEDAESPLKKLWELFEPVRDEASLLVQDASTYSVDNLLKMTSAMGVRDGAYPPLDVELAREYFWQWVDVGLVSKPGPTARTLQDHCAVVTGASGGMGAAIARALAEAGAAVCLAARRSERIQALADELHRRYGVRTCAVMTDVTKRNSVKECIKTAEAQLGAPISLLVNNAGVMHYTYMRNLKEDEWEQAVDVNCKGVLNGIGAVLTGMLDRGRGHIINISSDAGRKAFPGLAVYSGTKFFVEATSQALRTECVGTGVKVTCIQPGDCKTELPACTTDEEARSAFAQPSTDRNVWLDPMDVARTIVFVASQPEHVAINEILVEPRDAPA
eukprot:CAMPEP_0174705992 /NCGR_PEP_ID=MMETSP1094-20130205/9007_1 /TAXON_ID=156173 /ORGANISM="Chrysochromulina brevifilum, Strain UTEX LB 985" /LENGTH=1408 /DNA_ID=CAMNT_0015904217 /DNA_START=132 /DNA_END=4358 /DNA_ORIENTATION=+